MREPGRRLILADAGATESLGASIAAALPDLSGQALVIYLCGDLGAGKTTFSRGLLRRLGVTGIVRSPTYTLVESYALPLLVCVHADLYRLRQASELEELGLRDSLQPNHVLLIEWPEKGGEGLPDPDLIIRLDYAPQGRVADLEARSDLGRALASCVA